MISVLRCGLIWGNNQHLSLFSSLFLFFNSLFYPKVLLVSYWTCILTPRSSCRPPADGVPSDWLAQCDWASWRSIFAGISPKRRELWRPQGKSTWPPPTYSGAVGRSRARQFDWPSVVCTISNSPPPRQIGGIDLFGDWASKTCLFKFSKTQTQ